MFSIDNMGKTYEPISQDGGETLPMYEMRPNSDFKHSSLDARAPLHAAPAAPTANTGNFDFTTYVPYQLEVAKCGLFPEFYHHFKKNFGAESAENRAYCSRSIQDFTSSYVGNEVDILSSVARVEADFDLKFRKCLHPDTLRAFAELTFTRSCVENELRERIEERRDLVSGPARLKILTQMCKADGKVEPLIDFCAGFGYPELFFWVYLIQVFGDGAISSPNNHQLLNFAAQKWQDMSGSLEYRAQGFAEECRPLQPTHPAMVLLILMLGSFIFVGLIATLALLAGNHR